MQPDDPITPEEVRQRFAETAEIFGRVLTDWVAPELSDAEIGLAFGTALAEWRRSAQERQAQAQAHDAEAERRRGEPGAHLRPFLDGAAGGVVSAPGRDALIDPARVFRSDAGAPPDRE